MANTFVVSRNHLIFGLCLPLAVLLGYLISEPLESSSLAVLIIVLAVLCVPILMRWHHPLLIVSWNATINPFFLPGRPYLWMLMAIVSLFFSLLNRATNPSVRFLYVPSVTKSLLLLGGVVLLTALMTGGVGVRALGAASYGGKGYFYILAAITGYFAFTGRAIPPERAGFYVALFFLSGVTAVTSNLAYLAGPKFFFLFNLFPPEFAIDQARKDFRIEMEMVRISGMAWAAPAVWCFLLSRYGIQGVFDLTKPWRTVGLLAVLFASLYGGFRSAVVMFGLTFVILFCVEGLWRTRFLAIVIATGLLVGSLFLPFLNKMPLSVQRTLSVLPVEVDSMTRQDAEGSTKWRVEMWQMLLPEVPKYLLKGKGYSIGPNDLYLMQESAARGFVRSYEAAMFTGDYHNGPLSILIPFGIWGLLGFVWFLATGLRVLWRNHRYGSPELARANAFLFAFFIAKIIFFFAAFGSLYSDLFYFTGLVGLSVALNGGVRQSASDRESAAV